MEVYIHFKKIYTNASKKKFSRWLRNFSDWIIFARFLVRCCSISVACSASSTLSLVTCFSTQKDKMDFALSRCPLRYLQPANSIEVSTTKEPKPKNIKFIYHKQTKSWDRSVFCSRTVVRAREINTYLSPRNCSVWPLTQRRCSSPPWFEWPRPLAGVRSCISPATRKHIFCFINIKKSEIDNCTYISAV